MQNTLKIPQTELSQPKIAENNNNLTLIRTFSPKNPKIFDLVKSGVNTLIENNVNDFKSIRLVYAKRHPPNLKRILANSLFTNKIAGAFKCSDSRCLCCHQLLLEISFTFKDVGKQFFLKTKMTCERRNLVYIVICPTLVNPEQAISNSEIYRKHIRQRENEKLNLEKHLRTCGKIKFTKFLFLQLCSKDTDLDGKLKITL